MLSLLNRFVFAPSLCVHLQLSWLTTADLGDHDELDLQSDWNSGGSTPRVDPATTNRRGAGAGAELTNGKNSTASKTLKRLSLKVGPKDKKWRDCVCGVRVFVCCLLCARLCKLLFDMLCYDNDSLIPPPPMQAHTSVVCVQNHK